MSLLRMAAVSRMKSLTTSEKALLWQLADFENDKTGLCCPSQETLAEMLHVTPRQVRNLIGAIEAKGLIGRAKGPRSSTYTFLFEKACGGRTTADGRAPGDGRGRKPDEDAQAARQPSTSTMERKRTSDKPASINQEHNKPGCIKQQPCLATACLAIDTSLAMQGEARQACARQGCYEIAHETDLNFSVRQDGMKTGAGAGRPQDADKPQPTPDPQAAPKTQTADAAAKAQPPKAATMPVRHKWEGFEGWIIKTILDARLFLKRLRIPVRNSALFCMRFDMVMRNGMRDAQGRLIRDIKSYVVALATKLPIDEEYADRLALVRTYDNRDWREIRDEAICYC